jgi:hypothetical protein
MHRLAKRFLSFIPLAAALAVAAGPVRAQSLEQLKEDIVALEVASEQGMLHLIFVAEDFIDVGKIGQAIKPLNALAHVIVHESEIDSSTAEALFDSIESVIDVLVTGPQQWWCDADADGYTVDGGVSYFAPSAYCSTDPGLGPDSDDNDPNVTGLLKEWWCDYDGDHWTVYMGFSYLPPSEYCSNDPQIGPDGDDNDNYSH